MFASLSLYGYTTKKDLSGWGTFLFMGVIGLILASLVNFWLQSPALYFAISVICVLVFAGLTAYDTQQIKDDYYQSRETQRWSPRAGDGRAELVPGLHQHVPGHAGAVRQPRVTRLAG